MTTDLDRDFEAAERRFTEDLRGETPTEMDYAIRDALRIAADLKAEAEREREMLESGEARKFKLGVYQYGDAVLMDELGEDAKDKKLHHIATVTAVVPIPKPVKIKGKVSTS